MILLQILKLLPEDSCLLLPKLVKIIELIQFSYWWYNRTVTNEMKKIILVSKNYKTGTRKKYFREVGRH